MEYVLVSLKHTRPSDRYVTFWRPKAAGYCWPLSWAGAYTESEARAHSDSTPGEETFAVPQEVAYRLSRPPVPGYIDGNAGPVVTKRRIPQLRAAALKAVDATASEAKQPDQLRDEPLPPTDSGGRG
jgi:hypothetical protein